MTKILVKNGDWDKARADLGNVLDKNRANFNAQFDAAFGARKAAPEPAKPVQTVTAAQLILSRKR
jgi:hypothetical protein